MRWIWFHWRLSVTSVMYSRQRSFSRVLDKWYHGTMSKSLLQRQLEHARRQRTKRISALAMRKLYAHSRKRKFLRMCARRLRLINSYSITSRTFRVWTTLYAQYENTKRSKLRSIEFYLLHTMTKVFCAWANMVRSNKKLLTNVLDRKAAVLVGDIIPAVNDDSQLHVSSGDTAYGDSYVTVVPSILEHMKHSGDSQRRPSPSTGPSSIREGWPTLAVGISDSDTDDDGIECRSHRCFELPFLTRTYNRTIRTWAQWALQRRRHRRLRHFVVHKVSAKFTCRRIFSRWLEVFLHGLWVKYQEQTLVLSEDKEAKLRLLDVR
jgi:hypothetical protein